MFCQSSRGVGARLESNYIKPLLTKFKQALECEGVIGLAGDGQVLFITQKAEELLDRYVGLSDSRAMPSLLDRWFKYQISQLALGQEPSLCLPLLIEQSERQLIICLIPDLPKECYLLLLEERNLQSFSIAALELLGLTRREAEVLFWVSKDKINADIAKELGCCKGTVRKHLEHAYKKLGVQTRTGVVMFAFEKLGFFNKIFCQFVRK